VHAHELFGFQIGRSVKRRLTDVKRKIAKETGGTDWPKSSPVSDPLSQGEAELIFSETGRDIAETRVLV
jgi:hypothetical protein